MQTRDAEMIRRFAERRDYRGLAILATELLGKFEAMAEQVRQLSAVQEKLRDKVDALTSHEHYLVVITRVVQNGKLEAEIAGLGPTRIRVAVHPNVDPSELRIGAAGFVSRERNCLLGVSAPSARWTHVGTFDRYLDSGQQILIREHDACRVLDVADCLRDTPLKAGDLIGYDAELASMAYARLEPSGDEDLFDEQVTDRFEQLGGLDVEIARIQRAIDFAFRHPEVASQYRLKSKCGILLSGRPGNGKTKIARCCAGYIRQLFPEMPCRFMHVSGSSDYSKWFGDTERRIIRRFDAVREAARDGLVIVFWDEVDAIARRRGSDFSSGAPDRILNTFLSQIDGVVPLDNVILLFATNREQALDPALLRPGRVDEKIEIPAPNRRAAAAILRCYLGAGLPLAPPDADADKLIAPLLARLFAPNGAYAAVAQVKLADGRRLPVAGRELLSGALLENVVHSAARQAAQRHADTGQEGITAEDLILSLEDAMVRAVSPLAPGNVKDYVAAIPQDAQPVSVESFLSSVQAAYVRAG